MHMNYEVKEKTEIEIKELTPKIFDEYVKTYPGLKSAYEEVLEAVLLMNKVIHEYDEAFTETEFINWDQKQKKLHNELINSVVGFIDDLEKFDSYEAKLLKNKYNSSKESRLFFTQLALRFLK